MVRYTQKKCALKAKVREFALPVVHDGVVLGREAPIDCVAMRKALELIVAFPFEHVEVHDEVVGNILIRQALLRRVPRETLTDFVLAHIKPFMGPEEIMHFDLAVEINIEWGEA